MKPTEPEYIERLKEAVRAAFGITIDSPTDYDRLSADILTRTGERISTSTLKRMFGYTSPATSPRPSTLSALARYVGYAGWSDFRSRQIEGNSAVRRPKPYRIRLMVCIFVGAVLLAGIVSIVFHAITGHVGVPDGPPDNRKYELLLEECLSLACGKCDSVRSFRGGMDIISYKELVDSVYFPFVFGELKERIDTRVGQMFPDDDRLATRYRTEIFARCREVCVELMREIPADELVDAYRKAGR